MHHVIKLEVTYQCHEAGPRGELGNMVRAIGGTFPANDRSLEVAVASVKAQLNEYIEAAILNLNKESDGGGRIIT